MQVLNIFHVLIAIAMMIFILIQKGAGATAGAAFGSGASGTVFGSRGAGNFLSRSTWVMAAAFCLISLTMAVMASRMSVTPETDLGVMGETPSSIEVPLSEKIDDVTIGPAAGDSDLPTVDAALEAINQAAEQSQSSGDLPSIDAATDTAPEVVDPAIEDPDSALPDAGGENNS